MSLTYISLAALPRLLVILDFVAPSSGILLLPGFSALKSPLDFNPLISGWLHSLYLVKRVGPGAQAMVWYYKAFGSRVVTIYAVLGLCWLNAFYVLALYQTGELNWLKYFSSGLFGVFFFFLFFSQSSFSSWVTAESLEEFCHQCWEAGGCRKMLRTLWRAVRWAARLLIDIVAFGKNTAALGRIRANEWFRFSYLNEKQPAN